MWVLWRKLGWFHCSLVRGQCSGRYCSHRLSPRLPGWGGAALRSTSRATLGWGRLVCRSKPAIAWIAVFRTTRLSWTKLLTMIRTARPGMRISCRASLQQGTDQCGVEDTDVARMETPAL